MGRYIWFEFTNSLVDISTEGVHEYPADWTDYDIIDDLNEQLLQYGHENETDAQYFIEKDDEEWKQDEYYSALDYTWYEISYEEYLDYIFGK